MKKLLLAAAALLVSLNTYAQGTVNFANNARTAVRDQNGVLIPSSPTTPNTAFRAQLYYLPDTGTAPTADQFTAATALGASTPFNSPGAGVFSGGTRTTPSTTPLNGTAYFLVRVWETAFGSDYFSVRDSGNSAARVGQSLVVRITTGGGGTPAATPTALHDTTGKVEPLFQPFNVTPVPEPSVIGLGILGAGALLFLRRRK